MHLIGNAEAYTPLPCREFRQHRTYGGKQCLCLCGHEQLLHRFSLCHGGRGAVQRFTQGAVIFEDCAL